MSKVTLKSVSKTYNNAIKAVKDVNIAIKNGEFVVLVGPSGCGKSTLLRMIAGIEETSSGSIHIGPKDVTNLPARKRNIAMVFQDYALYPHMSVAKNLAFGLERRREYNSLIKSLISRSYRQKRNQEEIKIISQVSRAAKALNLVNELQRKPKALSGGQRQRVALGRAIVRDPHVFLLDEPLSNLDAKLRRAMRIELRDLHKRLGTTMIHVTHDQEEAMTLGDKLAVMDHGCIRQFDTPSNIYNYPADRFVASFIGVPEMNFIRGNLDEGKFISKDITLDIPHDHIPKDHHGNIVLGVRPENIILSEGTMATVENYEHHGDHTDLFLKIGKTNISARKLGSYIHQRQVNIKFDTNKVHFFDPSKKGQRL